MAALLLAGGMVALPVSAEGQDEALDEAALVALGQRQFVRCSSCHTMSADGPPMMGPHLEDIVGRPAGGLEDFEYTELMHDLDLVWDEETLDFWLENPRELLPGMCVTFTIGLRNPEHRAALIAYMRNP